MTTPFLQENLDALALRTQLLFKWNRAHTLLLQKDPGKASELEKDIEKYLEPKKIIEEIELWRHHARTKEGKPISASKMYKLLKEHKPGAALGVAPLIVIVAGVVLVLIAAPAAFIYYYKAGDAKKILADKWGRGAGTDYTLIALILGSVFLIPKIFAKPISE